MNVAPTTPALTCVVVEDQRMFLQMLVVMLRWCYLGRRH